LSQFTPLIQRQEKCLVTSAKRSCSVSKNTVLSGSGMARYEGGLHHHMHWALLYQRGKENHHLAGTVK